MQASRRAFRKSPTELFVDDSIPPAPQATDKIRVRLSDYAAHGGRMPGYTGYMPHASTLYVTTRGTEWACARQGGRLGLEPYALC